MANFPFLRVGLAFALSPLLIAFIASLFQGGSIWDETGAGAFLWYLFFTLPVGFLIILIGLIALIIRRVRKRDIT
jgi:predicted branched-subunit amino acid permease